MQLLRHPLPILITDAALCPDLPAAPTLLALTAGLWHGLSVQQDASTAADLTSQASLLNGGSARRPPGLARRVASGSDASGLQRTGSGQAAAGSRGSLDAGGSGTACCGAEQEASGHCVLLMGVASDGRVWQWQLPLLSGTLPDGKPSPLPPAPKPELLGMGSVGHCMQFAMLNRAMRRGKPLPCSPSRHSLPTLHRPAAHAAPARYRVQRQPRPCAAACGVRRGGTAGSSHSDRCAGR